MTKTKPKVTGIVLRPASTWSTGERRTSGRMFYRRRGTDGRIGIGMARDALRRNERQNPELEASITPGHAEAK